MDQDNITHNYWTRNRAKKIDIGLNTFKITLQLATILPH